MGKIVALAYNYKGYHRHPIIFMKHGLIGEGEAIRVPKGIVWAEAELGFVVDDDLRIGPHFIANDVTLEYPGMDVHLAQSKCRDSFCPIKQIDVPNPSNVHLRTIINGEVKHEGNTGNRIMNDEETLCFITQYMRMETGDLVLTGTPPHNKPLIKPGDTVTVEAVGIGSLTNYVENLRFQK